MCDFFFRKYIFKGCFPLSLIIFPTVFYFYFSQTHLYILPHTDLQLLIHMCFALPKPPTHPPFFLPKGSCAMPALLCRPKKVEGIRMLKHIGSTAACSFQSLATWIRGYYMATTQCLVCLVCACRAHNKTNKS